MFDVYEHVRVTPDRNARASWVMRLSARHARMLAPTVALQRSQLATRSGLFWLGRVGTFPSNPAGPVRCLPY